MQKAEGTPNSEDTKQCPQTGVWGKSGVNLLWAGRRGLDGPCSHPCRRRTPQVSRPTSQRPSSQRAEAAAALTPELALPPLAQLAPALLAPGQPQGCDDSRPASVNFPPNTAQSPPLDLASCSFQCSSSQPVPSTGPTLVRLCLLSLKKPFNLSRPHCPCMYNRGFWGLPPLNRCGKRL